LLSIIHLSVAMVASATRMLLLTLAAASSAGALRRKSESSKTGIRVVKNETAAEAMEEAGWLQDKSEMLRLVNDARYKWEGGPGCPQLDCPDNPAPMIYDSKLDLVAREIVSDECADGPPCSVPRQPCSGMRRCEELKDRVCRTGYRGPYAPCNSSFFDTNVFRSNSPSVSNAFSWWMRSKGKYTTPRAVADYYNLETDDFWDMGFARRTFKRGPTNDVWYAFVLVFGT